MISKCEWHVVVGAASGPRRRRFVCGAGEAPWARGPRKPKRQLAKAPTLVMVWSWPRERLWAMGGAHTAQSGSPTPKKLTCDPSTTTHALLHHLSVWRGARGRAGEGRAVEACLIKSWPPKCEYQPSLLRCGGQEDGGLGPRRCAQRLRATRSQRIGAPRGVAGPTF